MRSAYDGIRDAISYQVEKLPEEHRSAELHHLLQITNEFQWPTWPLVSDVLCRGDTNLRNMIRTSRGEIRSVDWEYSGWGDGAFEIADMLAMPEYLDLSTDLRTRLATDYGLRRNDWTAELRIQTYYALMLVWWVARFDRMVYEVPRGLDKRLVEHPKDWQSSTQCKKAQAYEKSLETFANWTGRKSPT